MTSDLNVRPGIRGSHTGGAGRWKNFAAQFAESPCQGAMEVILRVSVATGKVRASVTKHRGDISYRYTPLQQLFGDPFVGDTPIGLWESLWNVQPSQPGMIDGTRQRAVTRRDWQIGKLRVQQRSGRGRLGVRLMNLALGGLHQRDSLRSRAQLGVQDPHPGSVSVALTPARFLIRESGQPSQMTPIGASQVSLIGVSQPSGDGASNGRFEGCDTDSNPGLQVAGASLEQNTRLMPMGAHFFQNGCIAVIEIQQDIAGVVVFCIGLDIYVTAFTITNAQKSDHRFIGQLIGRPKAFAGEGATGSVVNQADQIEVVGHGRELTADGLQREEEAAIQHKCPRTPGIPAYDAFMVCLCGSKGKDSTGNGTCPTSGLSQKRAQAMLKTGNVLGTRLGTLGTSSFHTTLRYHHSSRFP
jgi:hypothetical protein